MLGIVWRFIDMSNRNSELCLFDYAAIAEAILLLFIKWRMTL